MALDLIAMAIYLVVIAANDVVIIFDIFNNNSFG
jgi:hypothetical protein